MCKRGKSDLEGAITAVTEGIGQREVEKEKRRVGILYWNRACYRSLLKKKDAVDDVIADLREAIAIDPGLAKELSLEMKGLPEGQKPKPG